MTSIRKRKAVNIEAIITANQPILDDYEYDHVRYISDELEKSIRLWGEKSIDPVIFDTAGLGFFVNRLMERHNRDDIEVLFHVALNNIAGISQ